MKEHNESKLSWYKNFVLKWDNLRISIRAILPLTICLSLGLIIGGGASVPDTIDFVDAYKYWEENITDNEISNLEKSRSYVASLGEDGESDKVVPLTYIYSFINNLKISSETLDSLTNGVVVGYLYGEEINSKDNFLDTITKYITIVKSDDSNLLAKIRENQGTDGYIYFTNSITGKKKIIDRAVFSIREDIQTTEIISYIDALKEASYPTFKDLSNYTFSRSDIENTDASEFTNIIASAEKYQIAGYVIAQLALEYWNENQSSRDLGIGLSMAGAFLLFGSVNYLMWVLLEIKKRKKIS